MNRRAFVKIGLASAATLAVGGVGLGMRTSTIPEFAVDLNLLSVQQYAIVHALADCIVSPNESMPSIVDLKVVETFDKMLGEFHPDDAKKLLQAIGLLENALAGLVLDGRFQTFTGMDRVGRLAVINAWRTSRLSVKQQAFTALHGLCVASYWGHPDAYAFSGYAGPPDFSGLVPTEVGDE